MFPNGRVLTLTTLHRLEKYGFHVDMSDGISVYTMNDAHFILCRLVSKLLGNNLVLLKMYTEMDGKSKVNMLPVNSLFTGIMNGVEFINHMDEQEFKKFIDTQKDFFIPVFSEGMNDVSLA